MRHVIDDKQMRKAVKTITGIAIAGAVANTVINAFNQK
jgi:hypothetical protein